MNALSNVFKVFPLMKLVYNLKPFTVKEDTKVLPEFNTLFRDSFQDGCKVFAREMKGLTKNNEL